MKKLIIFLLLAILVLYLGGCNKEDASIGMIGGADGPTAVFVTSQIHWPLVGLWVGIIVVTILVAVIIYRNRKRK